MVTFESKTIENTVNCLVKGNDYRSEVVNVINVQFLDFSISFFKEIVKAKLESSVIDVNWYKKYFISNTNVKPEDVAIYAGMNKKTITNMYGTATKEVILNVAENNFDYLTNLINELGEESSEKLNVQIKIVYNDVSVELSLAESLLVINALATKKIAIRGGAWSSIGKKVEKPLMLKLCSLCNVPHEYINDEVFKKDESLDYDREVDFKLYSLDGKEVRCEVKLMGKGNPESADAVIARDTNIFVGDTLSMQNKNQLDSLGIKWLELKDHTHDEIREQFYSILKHYNIKCC